MRRARALVWSAVFGAGWGAIAWLLGARAIGSAIWAGILVSPFIGLVVGAMMQPLFERTEGWRRAAVSLASVYLGGVLFALAIGVRDAAAHPLRSTLEAVGVAQLSILWGITLTGFVIILWPTAHFTHFLVQWQADR